MLMLMDMISTLVLTELLTSNLSPGLISSFYVRPHDLVDFEIRKTTALFKDLSSTKPHKHVHLFV